MNREWVARIAARSYPPEMRTERGGELVGTLLDAADDSQAGFVRQVGSVLRAGLAARARQALTQPAAQIAMSALAWAAVMVLVRDLVGLLGFELRATGQVWFPEGAFVTWILPALAVVSFTLKRTRISGILGLAFIVARVAGPDAMRTFVLAELILPLAGFALLVLASRRIPTVGRWVWLVPAAAFVYLEAAQIGGPSGVQVIVPLFVAFCLLPFQPSFAIGTALAWSIPAIINLLTVPGSGEWTVVSIVLVSCVPVTVITTGVGRLRAGHD